MDGKWGIAVAATCVVVALLGFLSRSRKSNVPQLGSNFLFGYVTAFRMFTSYRDILVEGYTKVSRLYCWTMRAR